MTPYSDLIERILLQPDLLGKLCPTEPLKWDLPQRIENTHDSSLSGGAAIEDKAKLDLVRGALLYAVDALDPAHRIFQEDKSDFGSYWHGMLHRREGDFDNARYWFRRAGRQPFFPRLHTMAAEHSAVMGRQPSWDPYLFTGECEQAKHGDVEKIPEMMKLQRTEFEALLAYCWRAAVKAE